MTFNTKFFSNELNQTIRKENEQITITNQQTQLAFEQFLLLFCEKMNVKFQELNPECLIINVRGNRFEYDVDQLDVTIEPEYLKKWYDEYLDFESYYR